jgi:hypothetical protein
LLLVLFTTTTITITTTTTTTTTTTATTTTVFIIISSFHKVSMQQNLPRWLAFLTLPSIIRDWCAVFARYIYIQGYHLSEPECDGNSGWSEMVSDVQSQHRSNG